MCQVTTTPTAMMMRTHDFGFTISPSPPSPTSVKRAKSVLVSGSHLSCNCWMK
ncbi:hypothetical protein Hamer_G006300, partial [Homarus americanus]